MLEAVGLSFVPVQLFGDLSVERFGQHVNPGHVAAADDADQSAAVHDGQARETLLDHQPFGSIEPIIGLHAG